MLISSRMIQNDKLVLPPEVQHALGIAQGDLVAFEIVDHQVVIRKAGPSDPQDLQLMHAALADEWLSAPDEEAYSDL